MTKKTGGYRVFRASSRRLGLVAAACALLTGPAGCGSPASDSAPGLDAHAAATRGPGAGALGTGYAQEGGVSPEGVRFGQRDRLRPDQPAMVVGKTEGSNTSPIHTGPGANPEELNFPDAQAGYRLSDRGEATVSTAPIDPAFDATEEDDPAAQDQATVTVEPYWTEREEVD